MSKKRERAIVEGFWFRSEDEAEQAKKEVEGVKFVKEKLNMEKPEAVLEIYNRMVRQNLFETVIGYSYMKELQAYLYAAPFINHEEILPIPVRHIFFDGQANYSSQTQKKQEKEEKRYVNVDYKKRFFGMTGIAAALFLCVAAMFAISSTANTPTVLNYEQKLLDRYSEWEEELSDREQRIREKEDRLGIDG